mmetsp:Transcript_7054/g.11820  ORF Transcript_7054/g.11820 Transcript_7054/m.11820 type:complete len:120 (+) Transcript_7054:99-458(+)
MFSLFKHSCALLALDSVAGMSEAMMREAKEKTDFWDHLDYASIRAHRSSVTSATCSSGSAGGYACSNVDLQSFISLENIGCGCVTARLLDCLCVQLRFPTLRTNLLPSPSHSFSLRSSQ